MTKQDLIDKLKELEGELNTLTANTRINIILVKRQGVWTNTDTHKRLDRIVENTKKIDKAIEILREV